MNSIVRRLSGLAGAAALAVALGLAPGAAFAQGSGTSTTAALVPDKKPPPGFERVAGASEKEQLDPSPLVTGAYAMFFVFMFGYVVYVARAQAAIAKEMADLADRIERAEKK